MRLLARTWNVYHSRTVPERRGNRLEEMIRLATADAPDVLALQEVPVWALEHVARWSGMHACAAVARGNLGGRLARPLTALAPGLLRSGLTGQANVILLGRPLATVGGELRVVLNDRPFRASVAAGTDVARAALAHWGHEARACHAVRLSTPDGPLVVANAHLTHAHPLLAARELARADALVRELARGAPALLLGDLNLEPEAGAFARLGADGWSRPGPWIDHVLGRGLVPERGPVAWPDSCRRSGDALLSDHRPVEAVMMRP